MDTKEIKKRFIERMNSSTKEELDERMLSARHTGFGDLLHESGLYAELTKPQNEKIGHLRMSMNAAKTKVTSAYSGPRVYSKEALPCLEEDAVAA